MKYIIEIWYYNGKKAKAEFTHGNDVMQAIYGLLTDTSVAEFKIIKEID